MSKEIIMSPLEIAVYFNETEIFEVLLNYYHDNDEKIVQAFCTACKTASMECLELFLSLDATSIIWEEDSHALSTGFCIAAQHNHVKVLETLLETQQEDEEGFIQHTVVILPALSFYPPHALLLQYAELATELAIRNNSGLAIEYILKHNLLSLYQRERALIVAITTKSLNLVVTFLRLDPSLKRCFNLYPTPVPGREEKSPWLDGILSPRDIEIIKTRVYFDYYLNG